MTAASNSTESPAHKLKSVKCVSFADDAFDGFDRPFSLEQEFTYDDEHFFNALGSFNKSKFSYNTECSSFCASMNSISGTDALLLAPTMSINENELDFIFKRNHNQALSDTITTATDSPFFMSMGTSSTPFSSHSNNFSSSTLINKFVSPAALMDSSSYFDSEAPQSSFQQKLELAHSHSISFSFSTDLFTASEVRKNSILFYEQWGISPNISQLHRALSPKAMKSPKDLFMENIDESERDCVIDMVDTKVEEEEELVVEKNGKKKKNKKRKHKKRKIVNDEVFEISEVREYLRRRSTITGDFIFGNKSLKDQN